MGESAKKLSLCLFLAIFYVYSSSSLRFHLSYRKYNYFSFPSLACHGLRHWNRVFLIPWLTFYLLILGIVTTCLLQALYSHNFLLQWRHIFLFFAIFTIFYCWSHVKKQYIMMTLPRPDQVPRPHLSRALCVMTYVLCVYVVSLCDDASLFYYGF